MHNNSSQEKHVGYDPISKPSALSLQSSGFKESIKSRFRSLRRYEKIIMREKAPFSIPNFCTG